MLNKVNLSQLYGLRPPAAPAEIRQAEAQSGTDIPE